MLGWLGVFAGGYATLTAIAYLGQRSLLFPAPTEQRRPASPSAQLIEITGGPRSVWALHAPAEPGAPTIVHFHGNGETLAGQSWLIEQLTRRGVGVFAVEYPGYGLASGSPSEAAICADAERAVRHLTDTLGVDAKHIVLQGQSLGSGVVSELARRGFGRALILISPYTSIPAVAKRVVPILPTGLLMRDRFDTATKAASIAHPVLIVHGTDDQLIPVSMGRTLHREFDDSELLEVPGAGHNDLYARGADVILKRISEFAKRAAAR